MKGVGFLALVSLDNIMNDDNCNELYFVANKRPMLSLCFFHSEKDDVEGDDVKRRSETGANLNMAVSRRGPTAYLSQYRTWVPRPEKNAHLPRTPLSLMAQTYGRVLEGCVFL